MKETKELFRELKQLSADHDVTSSDDPITAETDLRELPLDSYATVVKSAIASVDDGLIPSDAACN